MLIFALLLSAAADPACEGRGAIAVDLVVTGEAAEPVRAALTSRLTSACIALEKPDATKKLQRIYPVTIDVAAAPVGVAKPGFQMRAFQFVTKTSGADARGRLIFRSEDVHNVVGLDAAKAAKGQQLAKHLDAVADRLVAGIDRDLAATCPKGPSVLLVLVDPSPHGPTPQGRATGPEAALVQRLIDGCARMVLGTRADAVTLGMTHVLEVASGARTTGTETIEGAPVTRYALDLDVRLVQLPETVLVTKHESIASMGVTLASATATSNRAARKLAPAVHAIADEVLAALKSPSTPHR